MPKSRIAFWTEKFAANVARDARQQTALRELGWRVLVIWQCETKDEAAVERKLVEFTTVGGTTNEQESTSSAARTKAQSSMPGLESEVRRFPVPGRSDGEVVRHTHFGACGDEQRDRSW